MRQLVVVLIGASILALCNASCLTMNPEVSLNLDEEPKGCTYKEETHQRGTTWKTKDCKSCNCSADGSMQCCDDYGTPFGYDEKNCEAVFDKASCSFKLIPKYDPAVKCEAKGMVG